MNELDYVTFALVISPLVLGIVEGMKRTNLIKASGWQFVASLVTGIVVALVADAAVDDRFVAAHAYTNVLSGLAAGLMASGLWSGGKALVGQMTGQPR